VVVHSCNPSTQEAKAEGSWVWGQPGLHSKLQASLGYIVRLCPFLEMVLVDNLLLCCLLFFSSMLSFAILLNCALFSEAMDIGTSELFSQVFDLLMLWVCLY
jgi:hypothetical protein